MENEKLNNTKEKMLNSCKKLKKIITGFLWLIAGSFIVPIIIMLVISITSIIQPNSEESVGGGEKLFQTVENINNKVGEIEEYLESIEEERSTNQFITIVGVVLTILILDCLIKILKSTIENQTPFTADNIRYMKKIDIFATVNWIITAPFIINIRLIYVLVIAIITYIFKYGYQLQVESDETL